MRKVPVFQAVAKGYGFFSNDIGLFIQHAWYWTLLLFAVQVGIVHSDLSVWLNSYITSDEPTVFDNETLVLLVGMQLGDALALAVLPATIVAYGFFSARWQRALLLFEEARGGPPRHIGKEDWRAIGAVALFALAFIAWKGLLLIALIWPVAYTGFAFPAALGALAWLIAFTFIARLLLGVPAGATADPASFSQTYALGRGNGWRLVAVLFFCVAPLYWLGLFFLKPDFHFMPGRAGLGDPFNYIHWYVGIVADFVMLAIAQGAIATAYRELVTDERRDQLKAMVAQAQQPPSPGSGLGKDLGMAVLIVAALGAITAIWN